jgi:hypothetical protein
VHTSTKRKALIEGCITQPPPSTCDQFDAESRFGEGALR